jgi:hypothetical protein
MILRPVSAISFQEDDTFVVVFAFDHLAPSQCGLCQPEAESGAHPPHFLFARGSRGGRLEHLAYQVRRSSIQFSSRTLRGKGHTPTEQ